MKKRYIAIVLIIVIWNIVLTYLYVNKESSKTTITEENVYGISTDLTKVAQDSYTSVVSVRSSYGKQSGFIYKQEDDKAYIVTTYHGIGDDKTVSITFANSKVLTGTVVGFDYLTDVAVVSIESPYSLNVVKSGDNELIKNGEFVICVEASSNKEVTNDVLLSIVSNKLMNTEDIITYNKEKFNIQKEVIALSLRLSEGSSGCPIFNMKSEIIGMVQMNDEERTYSLTINEIKIVADNIINNKDYNKINLGIKGKYIKNLEEFERNMLVIPFEVINGYYVNDVLPNSIASKIGILQNDIIISINGNPINTQRDLLNSLYSNTSEEIVVSVFRADKSIDLKGTLND